MCPPAVPPAFNFAFTRGTVRVGGVPDYMPVRSMKVILGVSWVISGRRYDDGPPPWGIMDVEEPP